MQLIVLNKPDRFMKKYFKRKIKKLFNKLF